MEMRKANMGDLDKLVKNRMEFILSICDIAHPEEFEQATREYLRRHLLDGSMLFYLCLDEGEIVSSCLLCLCDTVPTPDALNGKKGELLNVYTKAPYRRRGLAKTLITRLIDEARALGVTKIVLDYTDDGYPLYQALGFERCERDMVLRV